MKLLLKPDFNDVYIIRGEIRGRILFVILHATVIREKNTRGIKITFINTQACARP